MAVDIGFLREAYFTFDKPVPYKLKCGSILQIKPVLLEDSMTFTSSYGILDIDKNLSTEVEVIQMSYLQFLMDRVIPFVEHSKQQLVNICLLCLGFEFPHIDLNEKGKPILIDFAQDTESKEIYPRHIITAKEFDDIKKIILYQNLPNFDDEYINPELKANMEEYDRLKGKNIVQPTLERRMAIISAHTGISKAEQNAMTLRAHSSLFAEVVGEVEFSANKAIALYAGKGDNVQWIFQKAKGKYDEYITSVEQFNKSMGGDGVINHATIESSENLISQYDKFIGG